MEFLWECSVIFFQNYSNKTRYVKEPHSLSTSNHLNSPSQSPVLLSELWKRSIRFHCVIISVVTGEKLSYENTVLDKLNVLILLEWLSFMSYWVRFETIKLISFQSCKLSDFRSRDFFVWLYNFIFISSLLGNIIYKIIFLTASCIWYLNFVILWKITKKSVL